ncbi:hypothetical protein SAMN06295926_104120 [Lysinibacillus sp. AC-3]|nr:MULTISPECIES: hypothetical protein [unclassified Lysinibacillus]SKB58722.1 hypothetical protein SAMN06295926_104120 [Lysinibacillus sp. AC-3]
MIQQAIDSQWCFLYVSKSYYTVNHSQSMINPEGGGKRWVGI